MIEIIAFIFMAAGIYFILRGLTEKTFDERYYDYGRYEEFEEFGHEKEPYEHRYDKDRKVKKEVKGGGVVLIGPIPIVFGESRYAFYALVLAIVLMVLSIFFIIATNI